MNAKPATIKLHAYQQDAIKMVLNSKGKLGMLPTGAGMNVVVAHIKSKELKK